MAKKRKKTPKNAYFFGATYPFSGLEFDFGLRFFNAYENAYHNFDIAILCLLNVCYDLNNLDKSNH